MLFVNCTSMLFEKTKNSTSFLYIIKPILTHLKTNENLEDCGYALAIFEMNVVGRIVIAVKKNVSNILNKNKYMKITDFLIAVYFLISSFSPNVQVIICERNKIVFLLLLN